MIKQFLTAAAIFALGACSHTYCGTYQGVLPASSGPGIETTLVFSPNGTYKMESVYMDKVAGIFEDEGTYSVDGDVITLNSEEMEAVYFQMEEGQVRRLDTRRQPVIGELSEHYVLKKIKDCD